MRVTKARWRVTTTTCYMLPTTPTSIGSERQQHSQAQRRQESRHDSIISVTNHLFYSIQRSNSSSRQALTMASLQPTKRLQPSALRHLWRKAQVFPCHGIASCDLQQCLTTPTQQQVHQSDTHTHQHVQHTLSLTFLVG